MLSRSVGNQIPSNTTSLPSRAGTSNCGLLALFSPNCNKYRQYSSTTYPIFSVLAVNTSRICKIKVNGLVVHNTVKVKRQFSFFKFTSKRMAFCFFYADSPTCRSSDKFSFVSSNFIMYSIIKP